MTRLFLPGEPLHIQAEQGRPTAFGWRGEMLEIIEINHHWRVDLGWWDPNVCINREYWEVLTDTGLLCLLYHDLPQGDWFLSRIYD
ncbi:MAG: hypothetical protein BWY10_00478 [Chloroflexi bacterium ADurb.Bin180]|nr:MAG: hypothetical protein BWY10_00478 [Chloroflexi bacterium ADurb.Bin180]